MAPYRNLNAWKHAQRLAVECAKLARGFPPYEQEALADELRQSAYRVPISLADGVARRGTREAQECLDTARAALAAVETILEIARDLGYVEPVDYARLDAVATEASKTLYGFTRKVRGEGRGETERDGAGRDKSEADTRNVEVIRS